MSKAYFNWAIPTIKLALMDVFKLACYSILKDHNKNIQSKSNIMVPVYWCLTMM